ncbi:MAG: alpha/beta fold hydrolase [Gammaproteobacteria bacterium]|nr:alpha/beta fold hydrolase [Gammaproteobacteria bacterium]
MKEAVILIHGVMMNGAEMWRLRQRLREAGYACYPFHYSSVKTPPEENVQLLHEFVKSIDARVIHFVCHSLGGLLLLHYFDKKIVSKNGRIVLLGSPVNGSEVARRLCSSRFTRWILGRSVEYGLLGGRPLWMKSRDLGIIAGSLPLGMGLIVGGPDSPHDGTVAVEETYLGGATDHLVLAVSHFGLLYSERVAVQTITFLRAGKFGDEATNLLFDATG